MRREPSLSGPQYMIGFPEAIVSNIFDGITVSNTGSFFKCTKPISHNPQYLGISSRACWPTKHILVALSFSAKATIAFFSAPSPTNKK